MTNTIAVILAAGLGTRMKSDVPKVLHDILGKPIIRHIIDSLKAAGLTEIVTVAGYGGSSLKDAAADTKIVLQRQLSGSADAVNTAKSKIGKYSGDVLVICGDTPLIRTDTIKKLLEKHKASGAALTVLTAKLKDPTGYGRIVRQDNGMVSRIVEEVDAGLYEEVINEINVGTYCFKADSLFQALAEVKADNPKKEYFLTDTIGILHKKGAKIESLISEDPAEAVGINSRKDLAEATAILKNRILDEIMALGVTIEDTATTTVYPGVKIGRDSVIRPNTVIESGVEIGRRCHIGPFARIRSGVWLGDNVEVGNFVELVRTRLGDNTKVKHHAYLGDTITGKCVNVGAGTITANYDGRKKNRTIIEDGAFIGVNSVLIAPVRISAFATVGAGCVVPKNHNVPKGATVVGVPARIFKARRGKDRRLGK